MIYDLIIIGAGPAGITASIYASRYKINHIVLGEVPGGLITEAHSICNFPTEIEINGIDLMEKMQNHAKHLGAEIIIMEKIIKMEKENDFFNIFTESQKKFQAKNVLLATGTKHRKLEIMDEDKYLGKGLAYCATCDAMFFRDKVVSVVGGGNSALTAALYLSKIAKKVYLIVRGSEFKGEVAWIEQVNKDKKIEVLFNNKVVKLEGDNKLEKIYLEKEVAGKNILILDGLFAEIGTEPDPSLSNELNLQLDKGYIVVNAEQKTSVEGVWAAGDITTNSSFFRQVITACSEGAVASYSIFSYLQKNKK